MFTGIIEAIGKVKGVAAGNKSSKLTFSLPEKFDDVHMGDSIAVNGVCLTVCSLNKEEWSADVMPETMKKSGLGELRPGSEVNMERAMAADGRFGGHIVSGHIDGMGTIVKRTADDIAVWFEIRADEKLMRYIVLKGSVTIDGISLTVADVSDNTFKVSVIPHTLAETILYKKVVGGKVNLETDIIAKYVEKLFSKKEQSGINEDFLRDKGFF